MPQEKFVGQYQVMTLNESFKSTRARCAAEMKATGRIFIPPTLILDRSLIQWIKRLEDVLTWRIFASPEHLKEIGPSLIADRRGVDA
ncbi:hypothetical protein CCS01_17270 [Rhodopila globiformis]|uniref:Uncharacterized protein n=2 Tax=Rhodopila globiformis TaxID=1071 RepID=A0A2S6NAB5_RHOGL|nr:hypothetical protein CCS01_17270 [Rhodopila globiformis]